MVWVNKTTGPPTLVFTDIEAVPWEREQSESRLCGLSLNETVRSTQRHPTPRTKGVRADFVSNEERRQTRHHNLRNRCPTCQERTAGYTNITHIAR